jgi:hypothetical protein
VKSIKKRKPQEPAALISAAETAGRSLGRAVGVVERAIGRVRARGLPTPTPKPKAGKRR